MKIVFLDALTCNNGDLSWADIQALGDLTVFQRSSPSEVLVRVEDAEVIITNKCLITESVLAQAKNLKMVCVAATGFNNIDIVACRRLNVCVANVANYSTFSVVQQVFAMLLNLLNKPEYYSKGVKLNRWANSPDFAYTDAPIRNISSMTFGILGYGTIGKAVARTAISLGAKVLAYRRSKESPDTPGVKMVDFKTLLEECDILSMHLSGNKESKYLMNSTSLNHLKSNAILINTSRGMVVNEHDLCSWLKNNPNAHALLDVLEKEPPQKDHQLYLLKNCTITPHQAWIGQDSRRKLLKGIAKNIEDFRNGDLITL